MSDDVILKAVNVSKQYRLGTVGTGTLSHDLNRFWARIRGKEDPYLKIGAVNDRSAAASSDYVWAIKDINFEVKRGEILGIIGKNGAGKSTLLKILSRVTSPTTGSIKTKGRIASLLEVGTGMHPELTGRENVYLNGAILGMTKAEIASKIDEIVEFSGCQMYIDTPVKRYSSGMRVRLGFAVAAFLEPDILVVDEVLAVGDAEFQKKAIGKMQDISNTGGRTVLFVSHDMKAMEKLTSRCVLLENGMVKSIGPTNETINLYLKNSLSGTNFIKYTENSGNEFATIMEAKIMNNQNEIVNNFEVSENIKIELKYIDSGSFSSRVTGIIHILNERSETIFASNDFENENWGKTKSRKATFISTCTIPSYLLKEGSYTVLIALGSYNPNLVHFIDKESLSFRVINSPDVVKGNYNLTNSWPGIVRPKLDWNIVEVVNG
ncbi:ABC transporter ATP-binding protein [uncultured Nonlabens sp.]|uniref:ABC transporter ATP-binding protein n=1 Tax=uncultured Nonlabens sp. TaxID=859306 RepID=UPI002608C227|nr:ABC transporter ATP-binding protein [uncultured Nonlabens sp.]